MSLTGAPPMQSKVVEVSDSPRLLGALIDISVSVAMAVATIAALVAYGDLVGRMMTFPEAVVVLLLGWTADVLLYAVPLAKVGGSIGNLVTGRRVIDAEVGTRLPVRRAVRRYFARRNVLRWQQDVDRRTLELRASGRGMTGLMRPDGSGPLVSHADRVVGSAVVRSN